MKLDFKVGQHSKPNLSPDALLESKIKELEEIINQIKTLKEDKKNFAGKYARKNLEKGLVKINKAFEGIIKNDAIDEILECSDESLKKKFLNIKKDIMEEIRNNDYILFKMIVKDTETLSSRAQNFCTDLQNKNKQQTADINNVRHEMKRATEEAKEAKKDLVSIMGLFIGVFSFFQLNFSQIDNLGKYDAFDRVLYMLIFNLVFLLGIFFMFTIIDFIVHKDPRMLGSIFNREKGKITRLGKVAIIIITITVIGSLILLKKNSNNRFVEIEKEAKKASQVSQKTKFDLEKIEKENRKNSLDIEKMKEDILDLRRDVKLNPNKQYISEEILRIEREILDLEKRLEKGNIEKVTQK